MSLRPRQASKTVNDPLYNRALSVLASAQVRAERTATSIMSPHVPASASVGAFVSVPDAREHDDLASRVTALEAKLSGSTEGLSATQKTMEAHLQAYGELVNRVGQLETRVSGLAGDTKQLETEQRSHERADLRVEQTVAQLQSEIDRLSNRLNRHERNREMHDGDHERHEPKGFQENDQPQRFMGSGLL